MPIDDSTCIFCDIPRERIIAANSHAYAIRDGFPVTVLHSLVIPKRHIADYFGLSPDELLSCDALLRELRGQIQQLDDTVSGFNIGMNAGTAAGQTILHCHIHLIPRREGDVANPRGGVRHVISGMGEYDPNV